jgi:phosphate acetyltransferase
LAGITRNFKPKHRDETPEPNEGTNDRDVRHADEAEIASVSAFGIPPSSKYERLIARAKEGPAVRTIVAHPCDETSLGGSIGAAETGLIVPILVGPRARILDVARKRNLDIARFEIVDAPHSDAAAARAVELIHQGKGELFMKGSLHTDELMREVTSSKTGLRPKRHA